MSHIHRLTLPIEQAATLWCIRVWTLDTHDPAGAAWRIPGMLARLGAPAAAPAFLALMAAIRRGAPRPIAIGCICSPTVSQDERALLDVLGLVQDHRGFEATLLLRSLLSPAGVRDALPAIEHFTTALARAGRTLPAPDDAVRHTALAPASLH